MNVEINNYIQQQASNSIYFINIDYIWGIYTLISLYSSGLFKNADKSKSLIYKILKTITRHYFK